MLPPEFEAAVPASERLQTDALEPAVTEIGEHNYYVLIL
jgi:hypothetical protein